MNNIKFNFEGKVVLITGSSVGIGAETARIFAKAGAYVVITGRDAQKLSNVANDCQQISPNNYNPLEVVAEVTKEEDLKRLVELTIKEFGRLDVLINNAGISSIKPFTDSDYMQTFETVMQTNLKSAVYLTHLCVEYLAKTKGNIVNISSVVAITGGKNGSPYVCSKAALDMFTKCMAVDLGSKGIRVNSVNPGLVRTELLRGLDKNMVQHFYAKYAEKYPVGRVGEPEDIANAILYLASDVSSFITGTILVADGGHIAANVAINL